MRPSTCTRSIGIDVGHRVFGHESKCAHLHGHRYKIEITARAALDELGRVIDFGVIKGVIGEWLLDQWDHGLLLFRGDPLVELLQGQAVREGVYQKLYVLDENPTAENMARFLLLRSALLLKEAGHPEVEVVKVRVWETPNCYAEACLD